MVFLQISFGIVVASLMAAIAIPILGWFLPKRITVHQSHSFFIPTHHVSQLLLQPETYPHWRPGIRKVHIIDPQLREWEECYGDQDCITYRAQVEDQAHVIHQFSIKNKSPFKVNRTYKIWEQDHMSFLKVEDELHITSPYLRSLAFFFYNHKQFLQQEIRRFTTFSEEAR